MPAATPFIVPRPLMLVTFMEGSIVDNIVNEESHHAVKVEGEMKDQPGATVASATAEVELPGQSIRR